MLNGIRADESAVEVRSFPTVPAVFCVIVFTATMYALFFRDLGVVDAGIPIFVVAVFAVLLERKVSYFDSRDGSITLLSRRLTGERVRELSFAEVRGVGIRTGGGSRGHTGVVTLHLEGEQVGITSMASLNHRSQRKAVAEIERVMTREPVEVV